MERITQKLSFTVSESPAKNPPPGSPTWPLWREICIQSLPFNKSFRVPSKGTLPPGIPHRTPIDRDAPFPELFFCLSMLLVK
jgi:hypothetical protein